MSALEAAPSRWPMDPSAAVFMARPTLPLGALLVLDGARYTRALGETTGGSTLDRARREELGSRTRSPRDAFNIWRVTVNSKYFSSPCVRAPVGFCVVE